MLEKKHQTLTTNKKIVQRTCPMRTSPKVIKMWLCRAFDFVYGLKYEENIKNATTLGK